MILYLITPTLGLLRNYIKYKKLDILVFIRTPIIYLLLNILLKTNNIYQILIIERWLLFVYKSILSIIYDDYNRKKEKYMKKYKMLY